MDKKDKGTQFKQGQSEYMSELRLFNENMNHPEISFPQNISFKHIRGHAGVFLEVLVHLPCTLSTDCTITFYHLNHVSSTYTNSDCVVLSYDALFTYTFWYNSMCEYDSTVQLLNIHKRY